MQVNLLHRPGSTVAQCLIQQGEVPVRAEAGAMIGMSPNVNMETSSGGLMKGVKIDPSMFKEDDVEILEDLIVAAHNDAKAKVEATMAERTKELTAGLPIPPGMKLPF